MREPREERKEGRVGGGWEVSKERHIYSTSILRVQASKLARSAQIIVI